MNNKEKVSAFLFATKNTLPRNIQEQIVRQMQKNEDARKKYERALDIILERGGRRKNLMYHGFFNPENYESIKNMKNALSRSMLKKYNASKKKIVDFVMDDSTALSTKEKKNIVYKMLTNRTWDKNKMVFVSDLKYISSNGDINLITKARKNLKFSRRL